MPAKLGFLLAARTGMASSTDVANEETKSGMWVCVESDTSFHGILDAMMVHLFVSHDVTSTSIIVMFYSHYGFTLITFWLVKF